MSSSYSTTRATDITPFRNTTIEDDRCVTLLEGEGPIDAIVESSMPRFERIPGDGVEVEIDTEPRFFGYLEIPVTDPDGFVDDFSAGTLVVRVVLQYDEVCRTGCKVDVDRCGDRSTGIVRGHTHVGGVGEGGDPLCLQDATSAGEIALGRM